jgi:hypothetical protein
MVIHTRQRSRAVPALHLHRRPVYLRDFLPSFGFGQCSTSVFTRQRGSAPHLCMRHIATNLRTGDLAASTWTRSAATACLAVRPQFHQRRHRGERTLGQLQFCPRFENVHRGRSPNPVTGSTGRFSGWFQDCAARRCWRRGRRCCCTPRGRVWWWRRCRWRFSATGVFLGSSRPASLDAPAAGDSSRFLIILFPLPTLPLCAHCRLRHHLFYVFRRRGPFVLSFWGRFL